MKPESWQNLLQRAGSAHKLSRLAEAETLYRAVLTRHPDQPDALYLLGMLVSGSGRPDEGLEFLRRAIAADPRRVAPLCGLSSTLIRLGQVEDAVAVARNAVTIDPSSAHAHYQLGQALQVSGDLAQAVPCYLRTVELDRRFFEAYMNAGVALKELGMVGDAIACGRAALSLRPRSPLVLANLGNCEKDAGRIDGAIGFYRKSLEAAPESAEINSNLVYALHYRDTSDAELLAEHRAWDQRHGAPRLIAIHRVERGESRRLRVGYVSPDFRAHSVAFFIEPVLAAHRGIDAYCYSDVARPDEVSRRLRGYVGERWRDVHGLDDEAVARLVREDRIDVLVDLAGHTAHHRLRVFARRPAPIQLSWIGYPGTTGVSAIQYRFTDEVADPFGEAGETDAAHTEALVRLPKCFLCYRPLDDAPAVSLPPSEAAGRVCFGSFNQLPKITDAVVAAWARILAELPDSRLFLKARGLQDSAVLKDVRGRFKARGIEPERLQLSGLIDGQREHLEAYRNIDVALDPFPYNGTTTTCEALWMGVPVVTLRGTRHAARVGASLLGQLGEPGLDLVTDSVDGYVKAAVELGRDLDRRRDLRATLRERMARSPLTDARSFVAGVEAAYGDLWRSWCVRNPAR